MSRKALPELTETMEELRMFLLIHAGTDLEDLVCDFARDSAGHMWLLQAAPSAQLLPPVLPARKLFMGQWKKHCARMKRRLILDCGR